MDWLFSPEASLGSLLLAAFLAATLIPLSSEVALFAVLKLHQDLLWPAIGIASLGNTLPTGAAAITLCPFRTRPSTSNPQRRSTPP